MNMEQAAKAFDKWMDDYVNDPDSFDSMTKTALQHLRERSGGKEPTYGQASAETFKAYYQAVYDRM